MKKKIKNQTHDIYHNWKIKWDTKCKREDFYSDFNNFF